MRAYAYLSCALLLALVPAIASAQNCEAYYPFDGDLADRVGGHDGQMIALNGQRGEPEFIDGRFGRALSFSGTTALRAFLDLNPETCRQLTISAWLRVDPAIRTTRVPVSTGGTSSPGFRIGAGGLTLNGPANGLYEAEVFRPEGGWTFIAGVYDFDAGTYTLYWRTRSKTQALQPGWSKPAEALWVGAMTDELAHPASGVAIDDLRITGRALSAEQLATLQRESSIGGAVAGTSPGASVEPTQNGQAPGADWQGPACAEHADCGTGYYCGFDGLCHPDRHAPRRQLDLQLGIAPTQLPTLLPTESSGSDSGRTPQETLDAMGQRSELSPEAEAALAERVAASRPPDLTNTSGGTATATQPAQADVEEQLPASRIDAVMDLQTLWVRDNLEDPGDEFYLVRYPLRGRLGTGDRIYTFDYGDQVWPLAAGDDWARAGRSFSIPQGAGRFVFDDLEPFEVYGFVVVLMEANRNTVEERTWAFGFGEFQNESGVTETISSAFSRAVPRDVAIPDYGDTSCSNVTAVFSSIEAGITQHFGDYNDTDRGLTRAILTTIAAPLQRNNRDRLEGVMWSFYINVPGGQRGQHCLENPDPGLFPPPGSPMLFDTGYTRITGEHRQ